MKLLIAAGALPTSRDPQQENALVAAVRSGSLANVRFLVEEIGMNTATRYGPKSSTLLMTACEASTLEIVKYLMEVKGMSRSDRDDIGTTPLLHAVLGGNLDILKYLIEKGSKITERDEDDIGALPLAVSKGNREMAEVRRKSVIVSYSLTHTLLLSTSSLSALILMLARPAGSSA
jgi:ankyrin repeat protein